MIKKMNEMHSVSRRDLAGYFLLYKEKKILYLSNSSIGG